MNKIMTVKQYLENPAGKGVSIYSNLNQIKQDYANMLLSVKDDIKYRWYIIEDKFLYCHLNIPSQNTKGIYYDVVIEFDIGNNNKNLGNLLESPMRVFSNCPSFVFTYANTFNDYGLLIPWLKDKYSKEIFKNDPTIRNPYKMISFEKSIYLSLLYLSRGRLTYGLVVPLATQIRDYANLKLKIQSDEKVLNLYNAIKKKEKLKRDKIKREKARQERKEVRQKSQEKKVKSSPAITSTKSIKKTSSKTKKVKRI